MNTVDIETAEFGCPSPPPLDDLVNDAKFLRRWAGDAYDKRRAGDAAAATAANGLARSGEMPGARQPRSYGDGQRVGEDAFAEGLMRRAKQK